MTDSIDLVLILGKISRDIFGVQAQDNTFKIGLVLPMSGPFASTGKQMELAVLLGQMKVQLPYVFRYTVPADDLQRQIGLAGVKRDARSLLQAAVTFLGAGWKGAVISYGMVLYKTTKDYPYGEELLP